MIPLRVPSSRAVGARVGEREREREMSLRLGESIRAGQSQGTRQLQARTPVAALLPAHDREESSQFRLTGEKVWVALDTRGVPVDAGAEDREQAPEKGENDQGEDEVDDNEDGEKE